MSTPSPLEAIFFAALKKGSPAERAAYLDEACGVDRDLRDRVERMLAAQVNAGSFLDVPVLALDRTMDRTTAQPLAEQPFTERLGTQIGPYRLLQEIGQGGMGVVYMAEQTEPVRRKVALKIIKPGMDTWQVIARFEAERQALSLMDHPNIARVLDAGTTLSGRPYFVMELVKGQPITEYCDQQQLPPRQRLELFVSVCHAIQHAHQKGIIHRDVKPSNVLVSEYDGHPVAKVIDFGVAKAISQPLTEKTMFTGYGQIVGTLEYMSPEQARVNQLDVDTRSDIYSLGVLLYELLTGSTPFDKRRLHSAAWDEMLRIIREEEPPKPSTRLSESRDTLPSISTQRQTAPAKLTKLLRGELDWIVMKALEKDRARRYETANGLARDIQRYLADETIEARPPSAGYRMRKFVRRHKGQCVAASAVVVAMLLGLAGLASGMLRAEHQRRIAETAREEERQRAEGERQANAQAQQRLGQVEKGAELLGSIFQDLDPNSEEKEGKALRMILAERLAKAAEELDGQAVGDLLAVAKLQHLMGESLTALGDARSGVGLFEKASAARATHLGQHHPDTLASRRALGSAQVQIGEPRVAIAILEQTVRDCEAELGIDHVDTLQSRVALGHAYERAGRLDDAMLLLERTLPAIVAQLGDDDDKSDDCRNALASAYRAAGRIDRAIPLYEQSAASRQRRLGPAHFVTLTARNNLAVAYVNSFQLGRATPILEELLQAAESKLGDDHPLTTSIRNNLATALDDAERFEEASALYERNLKLELAKHGPNHPTTAMCRNNLAGVYMSLNQLDRAIPLLESSYHIQVDSLGEAHPETLCTMNNLGSAYRDAARLDEALSILDRSYLSAQAKLGVAHNITQTIQFTLAETCRRAGQTSRAIQLFEQSIQSTGPERGEGTRQQDSLARRQLAEAYLETRQFARAVALAEQAARQFEEDRGADDRHTMYAQEVLMRAYAETGKLDRAIPLGEIVLKDREQRYGPDNSLTNFVRGNLARMYLSAGRYADALPLYEKFVPIAAKQAASDDDVLCEFRRELAKCYWQLRRPDKAIPLHEELLKYRAAKLGPDHPDTIQTRANLAACYRETGKFEQAIALYEHNLRAVMAVHGEALLAMNELAVTYWMAGQLDRSVPLFEQILQKRQAQFGPDHAETLHAMANLGINYRDAGRLAEGIPLIERAVKLGWKEKSLQWVRPQLVETFMQAKEYDKGAKLAADLLAEAQLELPVDSPILAGFKAQTAHLLLLAQRWGEAERLLREALAVREKAEPETWTTPNTLTMLGGALLGQKRYAEAEPLLLQGYARLQQHEPSLPAHGAIRLTEALQRLIELYTALDRPEEITKWQAELDRRTGPAAKAGPGP